MSDSLALQRITTADAELYSYMETVMTLSFPIEEYRELEALRIYTDTKPHFHVNIILHDDVPTGFLTYWNFDRFCYIEHFAIDPARRNGGHGKQALAHFCQEIRRPIVLEVELPDTEIAQRRIRFYQRIGFTLWQQTYQQPPYRQGNSSLPMLLMGYGNIHPSADFNTVKQTLYCEVYGMKPDIKAVYCCPTKLA